MNPTEPALILIGSNQTIIEFFGFDGWKIKPGTNLSSLWLRKAEHNLT